MHLLQGSGMLGYKKAQHVHVATAMASMDKWTSVNVAYHVRVILLSFVVMLGEIECTEQKMKVRVPARQFRIICVHINWNNKTLL